MCIKIFPRSLKYEEGKCEGVSRSSGEIQQAVKIDKALGEPTRFLIALLPANPTNLCGYVLCDKLGRVTALRPPPACLPAHPM